MIVQGKSNSCGVGCGEEVFFVARRVDLSELGYL
jgi:hypothetical protein